LTNSIINRGASHGRTNIGYTSRNVHTTHGTQIYPILKTHEIIAYYRYVDNLLIMYEQNKTNIEQILNKFKNIQPSIKFTIEKEQHTKINYLGITKPAKKKV
jgi:hypothetical protein